MHSKKIRLVALAAAALALSGCALTAESTKREEMVIDSAQINLALKNPAYRGGIAVGAIGGGEKTNPLWLSNIDDASFAASLGDSLRSAGLLAVNPANQRYVLDARLISQDEPAFGLDMKVTTAVAYTLKEKATGKVVFSQTLTSVYTATVGQAFVATARIRVAKEGSMRENYMALVRAIYALP